MKTHPLTHRSDDRGSILRRAQTFLFALVLAASQALGLFGASATTAYAADSAESTTVTTGGVVPGQPAGGAIHSFTDSDGNVLFCGDFSLEHPSTPTTYTTSGWSGDYVLDYIVAHGYSMSNPTANVYGVSGDDAHVATNYAIYAEIQGSTNLVDTNYSSSSAIYQATHALYDAAKAFSTSAGHETAAEAGVSRIWDSGNSKLQRMVGGVAKGTLSITKTSSNCGISDNNSNYSLAGAVYGVYSDAACTAQVTTVTLDANGKASTSSKAGSYYVKETKAPAGYALDTAVHEAAVKSGTTTNLAVTDAPQNDPARLTVAKLDAETGKASALGAGTLAGAEFTVRYYAGQYTTATLPTTPTRAWVLKTDAKGTTSLLKAGVNPATYFVSGDALYYDATGTAATLPLGTVTVQETKAPTGYTLTDSTIHLSNITSDGTVETVNTFVAPTVSEQVIRGDVSFNKVDGTTMEAMAGVAFKVTSKTTGESHVIVTDANGLFSSAASSVAHTSSTNGNDAALSADGTVDETKLSATDGVWFYGSAADQVASSVKDTEGALPYDTYTFEELASSATKGHDLVTFTVKVTTNGTTVNRGTVDDAPIDIGTTMTAADGSHDTDVATKTVLTDTVAYDGLTPGKEYVVTGTLHTATTAADGTVTDAGVLKDADGKDVTGTTTFTPSTSSGTVDVTFEFDGSALGGTSVVAFEDLSRDGVKVATHADIADKDQTVTIHPTIGTTATTVDGGKEVTASATTQLVDTVHYEGLIVGKTYVVKGEFVDATTTSQADYDAGKYIPLATSEATFTPTTTSGDVKLTFVADTSKLAGHDIVATEKAYLVTNGTASTTPVATHTDLTDTGQTIHVAAAPATTTTTTKTTSSLPWTGEDITRGLVALGLIVAGAALVTFGYRKYRKSKKNDTTRSVIK